MADRIEKRTNLKEEKRKKSIDSITTAARDVFVDCGFAGASMSKIAKKAHVPQALIYHYFPNKEELWKAVKRSGLEASRHRADFGGGDATNFSDFLKIVLKNRMDFYLENPDLGKLIKWEALESETSEKLLGLGKNYEGIWTADLKRLQALGEVPKALDAKLVSALIRSAVAAVFDDIPHLYSKKDVSKKQKEYIKLIHKILMMIADG